MDAYDVLVARAHSARAVPGSTSYFSAPEKTLDPALFDTRTRMIHSNVRTQVLTTLYHFWLSRYSQSHTWSTVWIAGSGASYQWSAARSPADLDVLIGVDYFMFRRSNPRLAHLSDLQTTALMNDEFRNVLDPHTAHTMLNGSVYEETFYVNPDSADIRTIMPYAAYNLSLNVWTVPPDPQAKAPSNAAYTAGVMNDKRRAKEVLREYDRALKETHRAKDAGAKLNAESWLKHATEQGALLFDEIHEGRHAAFRPGGAGYGDWANYRWQAGKANGVVPALQQLKALKTNTLNDIQTTLYGKPIPDAEHALLTAMLWKAGQ